MKKYIIFLSLTFVIISGVFISLDLINITNFIPLTNSYDWLSFFGGLLGSMIGGIVTFVGIYITLQHQRDADDEKNRLSSIPILEYKISYNEEDFDNSSGQLAGLVIPHINLEGATFQDKKSEEWHFRLEVSNIGSGHAQVTDILMTFGDNNDKFIQEENIGFTYKLVKTNDKTSFYFMIYAPKDRFKNNKGYGNDFLYSIKITVKYQDLLGNKYEQLLHACIVNSVLLENGKIINKWNTANLHYYENYKHLKEKNTFLK